MLYRFVRNNFKRSMLVFSLLFAPFLAQANYSCVGEIKHFGIDTSTLHVSNGFGVHKLCNVSEEYCKAWISTALSAKMANQSVVIYYNHPSISGNQSGGRCHDIGDWVVPEDKVYYFQVW
ncbi:hypothetical protein KDD30_05715 [Photobacterium sp. GJ3]|uniref:hypothetical protein n=1 Tax=Photobacterium sp. GJ3 TaxID=2829502 RepID=UPI001B8C4C66|nr:hypothetical protein [Photobacterium sp. GJ3]QUJ68609.1 hypothetical protein KDD30_05715 [Photobacterium sp. GJ3]